MQARKLVIIGAAGFGAWWLLSRFTSSAGGVASVGGNTSSATSSNVNGLVQPVQTDFGPVVPQLAPAYAVLKPIANGLTTPLVNKVNAAVGGVNPYGPLKSNGDGTYTDGTGAKITPNPDGTYTRKNPSFSQTNGGKVIIATGKGIAKGATAVGHGASKAYHYVVGLL